MSSAHAIGISGTCICSDQQDHKGSLGFETRNVSDVRIRVLSRATLIAFSLPQDRYLQ